MSQRAVEELLGRLLTDRAWRARFFAAPEQACRDDLYDVSSYEVATVLKLEGVELEFLTERLDHRIIRANGEIHAFGNALSPTQGTLNERV